MPERPLKRFLIKQYALVATAPFLIAASLIVFWLLPKLDEDLNLHQNQLAHAIAAETESFIFSSIVSVKGLAISSVEGGLTEKQLHVLLDAHLISTPALRTLYIASPEGKIIDLGNNSITGKAQHELVGIDISRNDLFREARTGKSEIWSDTYLSVMGGGLSIGVGVPAAQNVVIGEINLSLLGDFLKKVNLGNGQLAMVLDRRGQVIADGEGRFTAQQMNLSNIPHFQASGTDSATGRFSLAGVEMFGSAVTIPNLGWRILVAQPVGLAYEPVWQTLRMAGLALFAALIVATLAAFFMAERIAKRFQRLQDHAHSIANGGDPSGWPTTNISEFNLLAVDLHEMADSLKQRERQLSTLMSNLPGMVYRSDEDHLSRLHFVSYGAHLLTGYSEKEITEGNAITFAELIHPEDIEKVSSALESQLAQGSGYQLTYKIRTSSGLVKWVLDRGQAMANGSEGKVLEGLMVDVSDRLLAEENLARLGAAVEQAADDVLITDVNGIITYLNPAAVASSGYTREELVGKSTAIFKSGKHDDLFYRDMWETLKAGLPWNGRMANRAKNGATILYDSAISPIRNVQGEIMGYVQTRRDVTTQVEAEARLAQAQKLEAIGTLAGGIAHDFNNILAAIIGYTELALQRDLPDPLGEYLSAVLKASNRAADLVKQILTFSRMGSEEANPVRVQPLVKEALKLLRATLPSTIEIKTSVRTDCTVMADPGEIHRLIINLCTNASLAMKETGGVLEVNLDQVTLDAPFVASHPEVLPGAYVRLTVKDTGVGISDEVKARIFEPFFTTRPKGEGTGLGLSVVLGIVKQRKGTISVTSEVGRGTTFQVFLPCENGQAGTEESIGGELKTGSESILFVDDEPMVTVMVEALLKRLGYRVTTFTDSEQAAEAFEKSPESFDMLITDMTMPKMTGDLLAERLRRTKPSLPVILCTGYSEKINAEEAKKLGINEFLLKPVAAASLSAVIRKVLDNGKSHPAL